MLHIFIEIFLISWPRVIHSLVISVNISLVHIVKDLELTFMDDL